MELTRFAMKLFIMYVYPKMINSDAVDFSECWSQLKGVAVSVHAEHFTLS